MRCLVCGMVAAVLITGCGGGADDRLTVTVRKPAGPVATEDTPSVPKPEGVVTVHEKEFSLLPRVLNGGRQGIVKIHVVNDGTRPHNLAVDGPNGRVDLPGDDLAPGESTTFEVDLDKPGSYLMWCPRDHHRARGMIGHIRVGGTKPARARPGNPPTYTITEKTETNTGKTGTKTGTDTNGTSTSTGKDGTKTVTQTVTTTTPATTTTDTESNGTSPP